MCNFQFHILLLLFLYLLGVVYICILSKFTNNYSLNYTIKVYLFFYSIIKIVKLTGNINKLIRMCEIEQFYEKIMIASVKVKVIWQIKWKKWVVLCLRKLSGKALCVKMGMQMQGIW